MRVQIKLGWESFGLAGVTLAPAITLDGIRWTPVLWDGDQDPSWFKSEGLELCSC